MHDISADHALMYFQQTLMMAVPLKSGALDGQYAGNDAFVIGEKLKVKYW